MKSLLANEKEIRVRMLIANVRQQDIVNRTGKSRTLVNLVIKGLRRSPTVMKAISDAVGRPIEQLWPTLPNINDKVKNITTNLQQKQIRKKASNGGRS